jgi:hypothetical protein
MNQLFALFGKTKLFLDHLGCRIMMVFGRNLSLEIGARVFDDSFGGYWAEIERFGKKIEDKEVLDERSGI